MVTSFDFAAAAYDETFTNSRIGQLQRQQVYSQLEKIITNKVRNVLEVNCGTGEDAFWLANKGLNVTATDISSKMINVAKSKKQGGQVSFEIADFCAIKQFTASRFDMIFSNFGGLNCVDIADISKFISNGAAILTEQGIMILVIMPKNTIWEQLYFFGKGNFSNIFRRKKDVAIANVDGQNVPTYYYDPKEIKKIAEPFFITRKITPIGLFVPPSYLEPAFRNRPGILALFNKFDHGLRNIPFLAQYADHFMIVLEKK